MTDNAAVKVQTFRLETVVPSKGSTPWEKRIYEFPQQHAGFTWILQVQRDHRDKWPFDYQVDVVPPQLPPGSSWELKISERKTEPGSDARIEPSDSATGDWLTRPRDVPSSTWFVGAEIVLSAPPCDDDQWQFKTKEAMRNPDVILVFGDVRFHAHRSILSVVSPVFERMLNGEYREKNEPEVSVAADGIEPDDFEAFLHCVYPTTCEEPNGRYLDSIALIADYYGIARLVRKCCHLLQSSGNFSKVQKLKVALKLGNLSLEAAVMGSLTKSDIQEIADSEELRGHLGEDRVVKILKKLITL